MDINEMEKTGVIDYYLDLTRYIRDFLNRNYPLSKEDMIEFGKNIITDNLKKRGEVHKVLTEAMKVELAKMAEKNARMMELVKQGNYINYSVQDTQQDLFRMKQEMLAVLWRYQEEASKGENSPNQNKDREDETK